MNRFSQLSIVFVLLFCCLHLLARVAALATGAYFSNATASVAAYAMVSIVLLLSYDTWLLKIAGNTVRSVLLIFALECLASLMIAAPALANILLLDSAYTAVALTGSFALLLLYLGRWYRNMGTDTNAGH